MLEESDNNEKELRKSLGWMQKSHEELICRMHSGTQGPLLCEHSPLLSALRDTRPCPWLGQSSSTLKYRLEGEA